MRSRGKGTIPHLGENKVKEGTVSRTPISRNSTGQALLFLLLPLHCRVTMGEPCPFISVGVCFGSTDTEH